VVSLCALCCVALCVMRCVVCADRAGRRTL
jgi:hypothetical protein